MCVYVHMHVVCVCVRACMWCVCVDIIAMTWSLNASLLLCLVLFLGSRMICYQTGEKNDHIRFLEI